MIKIEIGQKYVLEKEFNETEVIEFSKLTGDNNPIHLDENYARNTKFKRRIVHGMLVASQFSRIIGTLFPGFGSVYLSQNLIFKSPVYLDDKLIFTVEVINLRKDKPIATLKTICSKPDGQVVIDGEAVVLIQE